MLRWLSSQEQVIAYLNAMAQKLAQWLEGMDLLSPEAAVWATAGLQSSRGPRTLALGCTRTAKWHPSRCLQVAGAGFEPLTAGS